MSIFDTTRAPGFSFADPASMNKIRGGEILNIEGLDGKSYAREYKKPDTIKRWPEKNGIPGDPIPQLIITVQSDERDPSNPLDEGQRTFYIEQTSRKQPTPWSALMDALDAAGTSKDIRVGGKLWVVWTGEQSIPGVSSPRKIFKMKYEPPAASVMSDNGHVDPFARQTDQQSADPFATPAQHTTDPISQLKTAISQATTKDALKAVWSSAPEAARHRQEFSDALKAKLAQIRSGAVQQSSDPFASTPAQPDPFNQPAVAPDPKKTVRAAVELELTDPSLTEDRLKTVWGKAVEAGVVDDALTAAVKAKLEKIRQPAPADPFASATPKSPWD